jgi:hypothetical protein
MVLLLDCVMTQKQADRNYKQLRTIRNRLNQAWEND